MAISVEYRSNFVALQRQWWHIHTSYKCSSVTKNSIQTKKKQQNKFIVCMDIHFFTTSDDKTGITPPELVEVVYDNNDM